MLICYLNLFGSYSAELFKMVCGPNETAIDINIPVVMLPQDAGASLEESLKNNTLGMFFLILYTFELSKYLKNIL